MSTYDLLIEEGREQVRREREALEIKQFTTSLLTSTDLSNEKIADLVGVTLQYVVDLCETLNIK
jgi:hypothetical protein